ncbi:MAG: DMT family transporter [Kosmotoga sp.]|uniref:DMT family transporter n=1 Tax=Kosmotoga arenicorallina TaxID=688066 RepID=A0A7C5HWB6_9BACT|nr:DMT family transporter [Kosmotoga sp.]MCD6159017.1 DMT family transporter [Kosmotoga sp.]HHF08229.1 DMT family transporter [Kosmotoga arenicorallina]
MKIKAKKPLYAALMAIAASLLWGSAFPVLKISFSELNISSGDIAEKLVFAGMRFLGAGLMLFLFSSQMRKVRPRRRKLLGLFLLGLLQTSLQYTLFYNGLSNTTGVKASVIIASGNFFVVLLAHFVYKNDKINLKKVMGLSAGFSGILLANFEKGLNLDFSFSGEGLLILSTFVGAVGTILAKELSQGVNPFAVSGWQMLMGSIFLIGIGFPGMDKGLHFTPLAFVLLLYSSFLSAAAFSLWYTVLKYNKAGEVTIYRFMIPLSGAIFSALFIPGESLTASILVALGLAIVGIAAVNYKRN